MSLLPNRQDADTELVRRRLLASGQVQGVGFRPCVYRLARELGLTGFVGNTSEGVLIEIQGAPAAVECFPRRLREGLPPLARLIGLVSETIGTQLDETAFSIVSSHGRRGHHVLISPDVGLCADCAADMRDPANRRHNYAFTNCTNCGPRYTITRSIPYDRAVTSMACFPMCSACAKEYADLQDRRFHAQPVACPVCGPRLWFVANAQGAGDATRPDAAAMERALERACESLLAGRVLALRGLGGFQLACDARNARAVETLRLRKNRPAKAFALMVPDVATVRELCLLDEEDEAVLTSPTRPALIVARRPGVLPENVAPDVDTLAVMLPTTPLHLVLFDTLTAVCRRAGRAAPVLVMTSGNNAGDPICLGNREALQRLGGIADDFLLHNRDILCRTDDSVLTVRRSPNGRSALFFFRRARGYVPSPVPLGAGSEACVFGAGADLKAACCFTRGADAFMSQHIGDLEHAAAAGFYDEVTAHLAGLLEVRPDIVVCDGHPDFYSVRAAETMAAKYGAGLVRLQHHAAHAAAVLAEYQIFAPTPVLVLDGFGYGLDGTVWGGELMEMDLGAASWRRMGNLLPFPLPGGDAAARNPWRLALALSLSLDEALREVALADWVRRQGEGPCRLVRQMVERGVNSPLTSSCGRLFDAVAAQLGICLETSYEGQAAMRLETLALRAMDAGRPLPPADLVTMADGRVLVDSRVLFGRVLRLARDGVDKACIALDFHRQLALGLAEAVVRAAGQHAGSVGLCGGVMNNALLRSLLMEALSSRGLRPLIPAKVPAGDGGIALGQAAFGLALARSGRAGEGTR